MVTSNNPALEETSDINLYLKPIKQYIEQLVSPNDYSELGPIFLPMMHTLHLIWTHSKYYSNPKRLSVILEEISNEIINQVI